VACNDTITMVPEKLQPAGSGTSQVQIDLNQCPHTAGNDHYRSPFVMSDIDDWCVWGDGDLDGVEVDAFGLGGLLRTASPIMNE